MSFPLSQSDEQKVNRKFSKQEYFNLEIEKGVARILKGYQALSLKS